MSMPFQLQDNLIRVPILINGSKADAVLDSGTGALGVDRTFALSLGLRPGEEWKDSRRRCGGSHVPDQPK
jgi:hypothetical protein